MGLVQIDLREVTELRYSARFGFYAPGPNWPHVPEWLDEENYNSDKTQIKTQMDEPSVALDPEHRVSASGAPPLSFHQPKNRLLEYLRH
jgi:hypothetical protein